MAPKLASFGELSDVAEACEPSSDGKKPKFLMPPSFTYFDPDDNAYFGMIHKPKLEIPLDEMASALELIPDEHIYPFQDDAITAISDVPLATAPDALNFGSAADLQGIYIKRPAIKDYDWYKEEDCLSMLPSTLLEEAVALHHISQLEHPNIVKFHGCRTRRGRITGLVLDRFANDLERHLREGKRVDKERILAGLVSAVHHLHSLGWAHNDIKPDNIMVNERDAESVLVDFGSSHRIGAKLTSSRGTAGWMEEGDDYMTSKESHDICALEKVRLWLDNPTLKSSRRPSG
ncbi:kinase-like domain-containing protein [Coniochaeta sp. 2T2.1]|nr:kinase-like domain-containing protein [Coniochaeta sp. 2T2.1]